MLTTNDLQYVLNIISEKGFQKTFNNKAKLFSLMRIRPGTGKIGVKYHYAKNTSGGSFGEGDDLSTSGKQSRRELTFPYKEVFKTIEVTGLAEALSKANGVKDIKNILKQEIVDASEDLVKEIETQLLGDGTGNSAKDIQGLLYHIAESGNYADQALDRSTYTWLKSYINQNGGTLRALTLALIRDVHNTLVDTRGVNYTHILTSSTMADAYEDLMGDKVRYMNVQVGDAFVKQLMIKDRPVITIPGYPANRMDFVVFDELEIKYLPQEVTDSLGRTNKGMFKVKELSTTKDATLASVICYLNLVCKNVYHAGSLQDIE